MGMVSKIEVFCSRYSRCIAVLKSDSGRHMAGSDKADCLDLLSTQSAVRVTTSLLYSAFLVSGPPGPLRESCVLILMFLLISILHVWPSAPLRVLHGPCAQSTFACVLTTDQALILSCTP